MPYVTTYEVAQDLGLTPDHIYALSRYNAAGMFPQGKFRHQKLKGGKEYSMYTTAQHQFLGRTMELAPGNTPEEKWHAILSGYELSPEEKQKVLYQTKHQSEQISTVFDKLNEMWASLKNNVGPKRATKPLHLPSSYDSLTPEEIRSQAAADGIDSEYAYAKAVNRDHDAAIDYVLANLKIKPKQKVSGDEIIDVVAKIKPYLADYIRPKKHPWRAFRSKLLGRGTLKAAANGYFVLADN